MQIKHNPKYEATDLSYLDLLNGLYSDIQTDVSIPSRDKQKVTDLLQQIYEIMEKYSA